MCTPAEERVSAPWCGPPSGDWASHRRVAASTGQQRDAAFAKSVATSGCLHQRVYEMLGRTCLWSKGIPEVGDVKPSHLSTAEGRGDGRLGRHTQRQAGPEPERCLVTKPSPSFLSRLSRAAGSPPVARSHRHCPPTRISTGSLCAVRYIAPGEGEGGRKEKARGMGTSSSSFVGSWGSCLVAS